MTDLDYSLCTRLGDTPKTANDEGNLKTVLHPPQLTTDERYIYPVENGSPKTYMIPCDRLVTPTKAAWKRCEFELMTLGGGSKGDHTIVNQVYRMGWAFYLPKDWQGPGDKKPKTGNDFIFNQWHGKGKSGITGPPLQLSFVQHDTRDDIGISFLFKRHHGPADGKKKPADESYSDLCLDSLERERWYALECEVKYHHRDGYAKYLLDDEVLFNTDDFGEGGLGYRDVPGMTCRPLSQYWGAQSHRKQFYHHGTNVPLHWVIHYVSQFRQGGEGAEVRPDLIGQPPPEILPPPVYEQESPGVVLENWEDQGYLDPEMETETELEGELIDEMKRMDLALRHGIKNGKVMQE